MKNLFLAAFFIFDAVICAMVFPYIDALGNKKPYKLKKMICSTSFVMCAVFASLYRGSFSAYAILMLAGFVMSWLGDLFLAFSLKGKMFILGLLSFLAAHIMYLLSFTKAISRISGSMRFKVYEFVISASIFVICVLVKHFAKIKLSEMAIPVALYAVVISFMLSRSLRLAVELMSGGRTAEAIITALGSVLFVVSDAVLVFIIFKGKNDKITQGMNLVTYYLAQIFLAGTIIFVA